MLDRSGLRGPLPRSVERLGDEGVADSVTILAAADGKVLSLGSPATDFVRLHSKVRRQWEVLTPHVSAAFRLRMRIERERPVATLAARTMHNKFPQTSGKLGYQQSRGRGGFRLTCGVARCHVGSEPRAEALKFGLLCRDIMFVDLGTNWLPAAFP